MKHNGAPIGTALQDAPQFAVDWAEIAAIEILQSPHRLEGRFGRFEFTIQSGGQRPGRFAQAGSQRRFFSAREKI